MTTAMVRVLLIDDAEDDYLRIRDSLAGANDPRMTLDWAPTYESGLATLIQSKHDIALVDYRLGARRGFDLLVNARSMGMHAPVIVLIGDDERAVDTAVLAAEMVDFLSKEQLDARSLVRAIYSALDRGHREAPLTQGYAFLQATLDALSAHLAILDDKGNILAVNTSWRGVTALNGFGSGDCAPGQDYLAVCDLAAVADTPGAADVASAIRKVLAGAETAEVNEYPCHDAGEWRWFTVRVARLVGVGPARAVVVREEISARKVNLDALQQAAESFASLFNATNEGLMIHDGGSTIAANATFASMLGYELSDVIGRYGYEFLTPATRALSEDRVRRGDEQPYEAEMIRQDGTILPVECTGRAIRYLGRPARLVTVRDISPRKAAQAALQQQKERYQVLFLEADRHARELSLLDQVRTALARELDPLVVNRTIVEAVAASFGYTHVSLYLVDGDDLVLQHWVGFESLSMPSLQRLPLSVGVIGRVVRTGQPTLVADPTTDPDYVNINDATAEICVPLFDDGRVVGALNVETADAMRLGEADLRLLTALGEHAGFALQRARIYAEAHANAANLAAAQAIAHVGSWETDYATGVASWSDEAYRIVGIEPRSFTPQRGWGLSTYHPDDLDRVYLAYDELYARGTPLELDARVIRPGGEVRTIRLGAELRYHPDGQPWKVIGIVQDITERRALELELEHQATHDTLTGLPNRALLLDRLGQALARVRRGESPCAVLFLDLDGFKVVNDTLGHDVGDRLLVAVGQRLRTRLRDADTLARLGGDEFVALLEGVGNEDQAAAAAERFIAALELPVLLDGQEQQVMASIGIVLAMDGYDRPEEVLRDADVAMYRAKAAGGGQYALFDPAMQAALAARVALERDLRNALARGEFHLLYQPVVSLDTGRVEKAEALVRWHHPERGLVSPGDFIPLAEATGLVVPLGRWVLGEACRQARAWLDAGTPLPVAVNLSAREFGRPDLVGEVAAMLAEARLDASWLRLEITERVAMGDPTTAAATLAALQDLGVQVAIDDFGTGYSSLAYLKHLPVNTLKIDKTFVDGLGVDQDDDAIAEAIIGLGQVLGLRVIAEGVETAAQADRLRDLGCQYAQGYYFARPLPANELAALLALDAPLVVPRLSTRQCLPTVHGRHQRRAAHAHLVPAISTATL